MRNTANQITARGVLVTPFAFSHMAGKTKEYSAKIGVLRLSGTIDYMPVMASEDLLKKAGLLTDELPENTKISVSGNVRSYSEFFENNSMKLHVFVHANKIAVEDETANEDNTKKINNHVVLEGVIGKLPQTKMCKDKKLTSFILASARSKYKSSYIPVLTWDETATEAENLHMGDRVLVSGRMQSRVYEATMKKERREVYELSAFSMEVLERKPEVKNTSSETNAEV